MQIFVPALFIPAKRWEQSKCLSIAEYIKKCDLSLQWNGIQSSKREGSTDINFNTDELRKHPEGRKSDTKEHILYNLIYMKSKSKTNL